MHQYLALVNHVLEKGRIKSNRTGQDTIGVFGYQMRFNLQRGFPMLTTKKLHWKSIAHELLWFISGSQNIQYLKDNGVTIWDEWADSNGDLGPVYGSQWRSWPDPKSEHNLHATRHRGIWSKLLYDSGIDQLANVIKQLKTNPNDRRMIVSAWNVAYVPHMKLPPCHLLFQFHTRPVLPRDIEKNPVLERYNHMLDLQMYQRSCDIGLGVPFNIASYAMLIHMVAHVVGMAPGEFIHTLGDAHIYTNHIEALGEQLKREPKALPNLAITGNHKSIDDFKFDDFKLIGYDPHPHIKMEVSV